MAFYVDDEEAWKCIKHPTKRRKTGICPTCLRDRLKAMCRECANVLPCDCPDSQPSLSSSSFSLFSSRSRRARGGDAADADRDGHMDSKSNIVDESNLLDGEPTFRRVRSVAFPFFRSRFSSMREQTDAKSPLGAAAVKSKSSFWSILKPRKSKKQDGEKEKTDEEIAEDFAKLMMMRSRSVRVPIQLDSGMGGLRSPSGRRSGWHFPSPMNAFRHMKMSKVV